MDEKKNEADFNSNKSINLSYSLTRSDLFWYNIYFIRWMVIGAIIFFALAVGTFIFTLKMPTGDLKTAVIWAVMGFGVGFSICAGSVAVVLLQIFFTKNETVNKAMTSRNYFINSTGIAVFNEQGKIVRTWREIKSIIKARHGFYIKTGDKAAIVIPRHVFANNNEIKLFETLVKQAQL